MSRRRRAGQRAGQERRPADALGDAGRLLGQRQRAIALAERMEGGAAGQRLLGRGDLRRAPPASAGRGTVSRGSAQSATGCSWSTAAPALRDHGRVAGGQRVDHRRHLDQALIEAAHPAIEQDRRAGALARLGAGALRAPTQPTL